MERIAEHGHRANHQQRTLVPRHAEAIFKPGIDRLHQAHHGGNARNRQHQEEQYAEQIAAGHLRKRHRQGLENKACARRRIQAMVEYRGEDDQPASSATPVSATTIISTDCVIEMDLGK